MGYTNFGWHDTPTRDTPINAAELELFGANVYGQAIRDALNNPANSNAANVVANAADTYLTGSSLAIAGRIQAGSVFRLRFTMTKTAAGIATPIYTVRVGTAGSTADTGRLTFTGVAQTAATDTGWHDLELVVRDAGANGVLQGSMAMHHAQTTTGLANQAQPQILQSLSSAFNLTTAGLILGVSCNPGASGVWTFQTVSIAAYHLAA